MNQTAAVFRPPSSAATGLLGMYLFLASLAMLFISAILAYVIIRITGRLSPPAGTLSFPPLLWVSTALVLAASAGIQLALVRLRQSRLSAFKNHLTLTLLLTLAFIGLQTPALLDLLARHEQLRSNHIHLYGLIFALILLHALHVLGGLIPLGIIFARARTQRYTAEQSHPVQYLALYLHFLAIAWVALFLTFRGLG